MEIKMIQTINSTMKIQFRHTRVFTFLLTLLLLCGVANQALAYKVTYHILTLPINNSVYHMTGSAGVFADKRLEAVRVVDNNAAAGSKVNLPDAYKSPLAKNFTYYLDTDANIEKHDAVAMYAYAGDKNKSRYYVIKVGATPIDKDYTVSSNIDVYVTYEYDATKGVDLSGATDYNITIGDGFLALNRGRNNRVAVFKKDLDIVKAEALASEDFVQFDYTNDNKIPGTNISTYWQSNDNKNTKEEVAGQFYFLFKFEGCDPYNILIGTAYNKDYTYVEKHGSEGKRYYKWYKGSHLFQPNDKSGFFLSSDDHKAYTKSGDSYIPDEMHTLDPAPDETKTGYFKSKGSAELTYNTFALLNNSDETGYVFMVSRFVKADGDLATPGDYNTASYNFLVPDGNYNNLIYSSQTLKNVSQKYSTDKEIYEVQNYVYKVRKKISNDVLSVPVSVSEYYVNENPINFVPEALKRKYANFTGAYKDEGKSVSFAKFADVDANATTEVVGDVTCKVIWLDYETSMPFETSATSATYDDLKWYNIHADKNTKYIASWDETNSRIVTRNVANGYPRATHFAFIGDPYDLKIVGRKSSQDGETPSALKYMALNATLENNVTFETSATTWGIVYDDDTADNKDCFRLKDNSGEKYLHRNTTTDNPLNGTEKSDEAVRITVDNLPTKPYVYYIRDLGGNIAVKASGNHEPSAKLGYKTIPESIRSPFIEGRTLTFYGSYTEAGGGATTAKSDATKGTPTITYAKDTEDGAVQHIVVTYDFPSAGNTYYTYINGSTSFNVRLNGEYIYYDSGTIKSKASPTDLELGTNPYLWIDGGADPYAMTIKNVQATEYVTASATDKSALGWDADVADATKFVIKGGTSPGVYEVMYATGESVDASTTYYNIGRDDTGTKIFQNTTYEHGYDQLRFQLTAQGAHQVTYHLIDKQGKDLLQVVARHSNDDDPLFPTDYRSPLVAQYHYYTIDKFTDPNTSLTPVSGNANAIYNLTTNTELENVGSETTDIYVTYTANNLVDMSGRTMYLLKYAQGEQFRQEDGSDGISDVAQKAVYPYCNGDCNFNVYGQEQYDEQQQGAASTRTRWAWFVESVNNDPYHVKIRSRQQQTYPAGSENNYNAYFRTYMPNGYTEVVTTLAWPGISGEQGTEYMVLGSAGQFRLLTTYGIDLNNDGDRSDTGEDVRHAVNSFEQYWKTWNTIRLNVLGDKNAEAKQSDPNTVPATPATKVATDAGKDNRTYLTDVMKWHSYEQWAYAIRWNDYNKDGDKNKKGWESIEHWYRTVKMGEGFFDFVPTTIDPVLILLDQHGWEVMRKPLPSSPDDPDKYDKYDAIRPYDSPMVKEYYFWTKTSKRLGFHQYHTLGQQVTVDGKPYTSTSLTSLPPYDATNVRDAQGNLYDQYVTYTVKDEYLKACNVLLSYGAETTDPADGTKKYTPVTATVTGVPFLIQQGDHFVSATGATTLKNDNEVPATGGMSQYIIENVSKLTIDGEKKSELWYLMPNIDIDGEMGYAHYAHLWASDYDRKDKVQTSGFNSWAFDPYNIQISSVAHSSSYFVTDATTAEVHEGSILGDGANNALGARQTVNAALVGGWDNRTIKMTNATFMAVQDKNGNMQLMPRFDQEKRLKDFSTLVHTDDPGVAQTYTKLYRPLVYNYHIIDNSGSESLRYQSGGDLVPQTPDWFKSPLAKDYKYYATLSAGVVSDEIKESLAGATLTENNVYVRYSYGEEADNMGILKGKWLTMDVNEKDAQYTTVSETAGIYSGTKPETVDGSAKKWQWKFLADSQTDPDPYAVSLYNRNNTPAGTATAVNSKSKFALLNWYAGGVDASAYTLAVAGTEEYSYDFVNGASMSSSNPATTDTEANVKSTSCSYTSTNAKIVLTDDVNHAYTYKIYTNDDPDTPVNDGKYGILAVSATQDQTTASENDYVPTLPDEIKSPLLNMDQFKYYEAETDMGNSEKELKSLYGMYGDDIYVRYTAYEKSKTEYKVPNVKGIEDGHVTKGAGSNDAALDINGNLLYNVIWYSDKMMSYDGSSISDGGSKDLDGDAAYVWKFEGDDPYAIKIKHKNANKYVKQDTEDADSDSDTNECMLNDAATTFMLLPSTDSSWEYGMLQVTGGTNKLCGYGATVAADPTKFIIFSLSTHKIIYHLVIANINSSETIPYSESNSPRDSRYTSGNVLEIRGSTNRDLTTGSGATYQLGETITGVNYCVDGGHITLGDPLKVPEALERPNCKYLYYVDNIQTKGTDTYQKTATGDSDYDTKKAALSTETDAYYYFKIGTSTYIYKRVQVKDGTVLTEDDVDCTEDDYNNAWQDNDGLNTSYKGLKVKQLEDLALIGSLVKVNVEYQFDDGLTDTNNGSNFVTNTTGTQWYTFETSDETPYLANFTYKDNILKGKAGRIGHYTNEFLWSPVGDPYGFKMYNRYVYKNGTEDGHADKVMTTTEPPAAGADLIMAVDASLSKPVYELLPGETAGYFKVQTLTIPESGTPYYIDNSSGVITLKISTDTEWTFGLSDALLEPYYLGAGNVGGLTTTVKEGTSKTKSGKTLYEEATTLMAKQGVVFDADNIVDFTPGYYRIFNQPNSQGITIPRYLSGYTHKTELTPGTGTDLSPEAIPMHFYEKKGVTTTFEALGSGFTTTSATQGQIPIEAPEYDPASIFYITGIDPEEPSTAPYTMQTQGLYVDGAVMASAAGTNSEFHVVDIGGAVILLHDGAAAAERKYLHYKQNSDIYDVKFEKGSVFNDDDAAKWCMEPANKMGLYIKTHSGGEEEVLTTTWYYSSYCVPFDLLIANKNDDEAHSSNAYTCVAEWESQPESPWPTTESEARKGLHPKPIGKYNTGTYAGNDYFVPARTPVLFSTKRATEYIKATIPTTAPSTSISTIFSYEYLEQVLTPWDNTRRVYVFGPKMEGTMNIDTSNGNVNATLPSLGNTNVGFHLNANPNKEVGSMPASWTRNNYYVLHNKIYYRAAGSPSPARELDMDAPQFVPVIFGDEESGEEQELQPDGSQQAVIGDGCIYDLSGRKVATEQQVQDGSWSTTLAPGIYILNGRKFQKK